MSSRTTLVGGARFVPLGHNRKLAPVDLVPTGGRPRPTPRAPFVSLTDVSIAATCNDACPFKDEGCYVTSGATKGRAAELDSAARGRTALEVITEEVRLIDGAFRGGPIPQDGARGGRDLRLHVGGDVGSAEGARLLAGAAARWRERGGGSVWTFTHWWREIPREAFGSISVLASVESTEAIEVARRSGYAAALVVERFASDRAFRLPGTDARIVPCPAETRGTNCAECRLCLDANLHRANSAIAFQVHGPAARVASDALLQLRLPNARTDLGVVWRRITTNKKGNPTMYKETAVVRIVNADIQTDDALVRVISTHFEATGMRFSRATAKRGTRQDKGVYVAVEVEAEVSTKEAFWQMMEPLPTYLCKLAKARGIEGVRVEVETMDESDDAA